MVNKRKKRWIWWLGGMLLVFAGGGFWCWNYAMDYVLQSFVAQGSAAELSGSAGSAAPVLGSAGSTALATGPTSSTGPASSIGFSGSAGPGSGSVAPGSGAAVAQGGEHNGLAAQPGTGNRPTSPADAERPADQNSGQAASHSVSANQAAQESNGANNGGTKPETAGGTKGIGAEGPAPEAGDKGTKTAVNGAGEGADSPIPDVEKGGSDAANPVGQPPAAAGTSGASSGDKPKYDGNISPEKAQKVQASITMQEKALLTSVLLKKLSASDISMLMKAASQGVTVEEKRELKKLFLQKLTEDEYNELIAIAAKYGLSQGRDYKETQKDYEQSPK